METTKIRIKETCEEDIETILEVEKRAFGSEVEAQLVANLLSDKTTEPNLSLLAYAENEAIGHILFTRVRIGEQNNVLAHILAPLAVKPSFQKQGIGGLLITEGLKGLKKKNSELVFVLGHNTYYPKYGFINNAAKLGFEAPYTISEEHANAWMVQELNAGAILQNNGKITCANTLMTPEYWMA